MKGKILRITLLLTLIFVMAFATVAQAAGTDFSAAVKHNINGLKVNAAKAYPVRVNVMRDGKLAAHFHMEYKDVVRAKWLAGQYKFVFVQEGTEKTLFQCGPYTIKAGDKVTVLAYPKNDKTPACKAKVRK